LLQNADTQSNKNRVRHSQEASVKNHKNPDFGKMLDRDILRYYPIKLIPAVTGLFTILILTRNLAPDEYGTYSVVMATVLLISQIFGIWLSNAVLYVYPDYRQVNDFEFKVYTMGLQGAAAILGGAIGYAAILLTTHNHLLGLFGALIIISQLFQFLMMTFLQSSRIISGQTLSVIVQNMAQLTVLCVMIFVFKGKETAALTAVLVGYATCIPLLILKLNIISCKKAAEAKLPVMEIFRRLFSYGMPMCIWFFSIQFCIVGDRILLKLLGTTEGLGQYASFRDLATGCAGFFTMPLLMASHPIIMSMWKGGVDRSEIEKLMTRNLLLITIIFVPIFVAIDLCGSELIILILGQKYLLDNVTMLLVFASIFLGCLAMYVQKGMEVTGSTLRMAMIAFTAAVMSLAANTIVIPYYGVLGAAMIVVLVQTFYFIVVWLATRQTLRVLIPLSFLRNMALWVIGVELVSRGMSSLFEWSGVFWAITPFRLIFIAVATVILYAVNDEVSSILGGIVQSFKRSKRELFTS
jgi:O-antigen/teichoic acid export membrane protein